MPLQSQRKYKKTGFICLPHFAKKLVDYVHACGCFQSRQCLYLRLSVMMYFIRSLLMASIEMGFTKLIPMSKPNLISVTLINHRLTGVAPKANHGQEEHHGQPTPFGVRNSVLRLQGLCRKVNF